jgi:hypothetical protein
MWAGDREPCSRSFRLFELMNYLLSAPLFLSSLSTNAFILPDYPWGMDGQTLARGLERAPGGLRRQREILFACICSRHPGHIGRGWLSGTQEGASKLDPARRLAGSWLMKFKPVIQPAEVRPCMYHI